MAFSANLNVMMKEVGKSIKGLSCIEPNAYCERFITSMS